MVYNIFSYFVGCLSLCWLFLFFTEVFKFDVVPFLYFCFCCLCFRHHIQEIIAKSNVMKIFPYIFIYFIVLVLKLRSWTVNFCIWSNITLPHVVIQFPTITCRKDCRSPFGLTPLSKIISPYV